MQTRIPDLLTNQSSQQSCWQPINWYSRGVLDLASVVSTIEKAHEQLLLERHVPHVGPLVGVERVEALDARVFCAH
jgi:hypothetical protein